MSTIDPSSPRLWRLAVASVIGVIALLAAALAAWGYSVNETGTGPGSESAAAGLGQPLAIVSFIGFLLAMPPRWRSGRTVSRIFSVSLCAMALAAAVGFAVAGALSLAGVAVALAIVMGSVITIRYLIGRYRDDLRNAVLANGTTALGIVTECSVTATVNGVPRHRMVIRFTDTTGTTRWVTKRATTWDPLAEGEQVHVHYDPTAPSAQKRMVVVRSGTNRAFT